MTAAPNAPAMPVANRVRPDHSRFPALDGMRAVAVGCVVVTHAAYWTGHYVHGPGSALLGHLDIGVAIFFVISGFLLSRQWFVAAATGRRPIRTIAYLWRRALRVLPLYWITVAIALLALPENRRAGVVDWVRHVTLTQIYAQNGMREGLTQTWSLCTEVAFYMLLPVIAATVIRRSAPRMSIASRATICAGALIGCAVAWNIWFRSSATVPSNAIYWLPTDVGWFAAGIAMAGIHTSLTAETDRSARHWTWAARLGASPGVCWSCAVCLYLLIVTPITGSVVTGPANATEGVVKNLLYLLTAALLVWPAVFTQTPMTSALLGNAPTRYLGDISYGVFLLHLSVIDLVTHLLGDQVFSGSLVELLVLTLAITIPAAALAYHLVERPIQRLRTLVPAAVRRRPEPAEQ